MRKYYHSERAHMGISIWQLLLIVLVILILFGAGKLPRVMADVGKGMKALRDGMRDGGEDAPQENGSIREAVDAPEEEKK